ncbi:Gfo/Idh/MocA family protein [Halorussus salinisoli]|uniref:Gfo/Idh/MocA family protein n=1 Tax=Halorussus salinisoli TaxID=2558242 RepID=UPI0010C19794|nr:Gfo/Idh/MocA family oxidoreductase [Halorussus salinisoli]
MTAPRIGVVGLGTMGNAHAERIQDAGGRVVAGTDISADVRESFAETFDCFASDDFEKMYESVDLDGVVVTIPNALHEDATVSALERDINVLVEKPLAHSVTSAERIGAAAAASDAFCTVGFVMRYRASVRKLLQRVRSGTFGEVHHVEAQYIRQDGVPANSWFTDPDLAGGGALVDIGIHILDVAMACLEYPPIEGVFCRTRNECVDMNVEDSASGLVRFAGDATASFEVAWATNRSPECSITVRGTNGSAYLNLAESELTVIDSPDGESEPVPTPDEDWLAPEDEAFVSALTDGTAPPVGDVEHALDVQRLLAASYESNESGDVVRPN